MPDDRDELFAMAKEQGRLSGLVESISGNVDNLRGEQRRICDRLDEHSGDLKEIKGQLGVVINTMKESGIRPAISPPEVPSVIITILKHPATPLAFALLVVLVIVVLLTSALTGRNARDLLPDIPRTSQQKP